MMTVSKLTIVLVTLVVFPSLWLSVPRRQTESKGTLKSLVETEQAFAKTSEERGARDAFMAFIADDGILFRPRAVTGKEWMRAHPVPPSDKRPLLAWQPVFADIAAAGDMGYTTGPWEFKEDIKNEKPAAFGDFVTVWKKQADGSWKFAVDLGISHPQSSGPLKLWVVDDAQQSAKTSGAILVDLASDRKALWQSEQEFAAVAAKSGVAAAFQKTADNSVRLYREGNNPFLGREAATKTLAANEVSIIWKITAGEVSSSGDLGYTYGTYEITDSKKPAPIEKGNYLRIWKKHGKDWRVVLDVANPVNN
jgi:ketosteroid isomerase-like protein